MEAVVTTEEIKAGGASGTTPEDERIETFAARRRTFEALATEAGRRRDALSWARVVVFILVLGCVAAALRGGEEGAAALAGALLLVGLFDFLVRKQRVQGMLERKNAELTRINARAAARVERDWRRLPSGDYPDDGTAGPLARDLNLFGPGSLFQLLGTARTGDGRRLLAGWLLSPAPPSEVVERQRAVRELASSVDFRQEFERLAGQAEPDARVMAELRRWATEEQTTRGTRWHIFAARALPLTLLVLVLAHAAGLLPPVWIGMIPLLGLAWILSFGWSQTELAPLELRAVELARRGDLLRLITESDFEAPRLRAIREALAGNGAPAHVWAGRLVRILRLVEVRYSPILYIPLQLGTLWDSHLVALLHRWRRRAGVHLGTWLDAIAEFEALCALAALAHENPSWTDPAVDPDASTWSGRALGHPLLAPKVRVPNDVELGPPGTFLLVTGSNMSGKSTLLRAIGTNVVLAQAGAPVCAAALRIPPTRLGTSFVIEDSLEHGVSYYLAELRRLKAILDESERSSDAGQRYLFLLDEILRGTNSGERQIAVRRILMELLDQGAAGAVSTHDLGLAEVEALTERSTRVHFREEFHDTPTGARMSFDYQLRSGLATTSNALALLELVGIRAPHNEPRTGEKRTGDGKRGQS